MNYKMKDKEDSNYKVLLDLKYNNRNRKWNLKFTNYPDKFNNSKKLSKIKIFSSCN